MKRRRIVAPRPARSSGSRALVGGAGERPGKRTGGESGIRTHDTLTGIHAFQACAFSHSAISPADALGDSRRAPRRFNWRRGGDSNPRYDFWPYNGLANRRLQPLGHLSARRGILSVRGRGGMGRRGAGRGRSRAGDGAAQGARGARRGRDSNPRGARAPGGFQDRCLRPLGHLSPNEINGLYPHPGPRCKRTRPRRRGTGARRPFRRGESSAGQTVPRPPHAALRTPHAGHPPRAARRAPDRIGRPCQPARPRRRPPRDCTDRMR